MRMRSREGACNTVVIRFRGEWSGRGVPTRRWRPAMRVAAVDREFAFAPLACASATLVSGR